MTALTLDLDRTRFALQQRWHQPHPAFASGRDLRSSDRGLLQLLYGGMAHGHRYQWHNGGRTLIDKTYLAILWAAQELPPLSISFERLAANLDSFIREQLSPAWDTLGDLEHEERHQRALELVEAAAGQLFGSQDNPTAASHLLLFLCPQLPVFPYSEAHRQAAMALTPTHPILGYADYHRACRTLLAQRLPCLQPLQAKLPAATEISGLNRLLMHGDWWPRRLLAQQLLADAQPAEARCA